MSSTAGEKKNESRLGREWLAGGFANAITSALLNPLDVAKTRLQTEKMATKGNHAHLTFRGAIRGLYADGGILGLWKPGLTASVLREMMSSGPRAGFYCPVRDFINEHVGHGDKNSLLCKILAAMTTGTIGAVVSNPIDLVKIRLMANPKLYSSTFAAFPTIMREEGFAGMYKGVVPSTLRGAFIATGELAAYDHAKTVMKKTFHLEEGSKLHILSSLITGVVATTFAAPFDLIKTRAMNATGRALSIPEIFRDAVREEGPASLFRGWLPAYLRIGPHALICFPIFEQLRKLFGLQYL